MAEIFPPWVNKIPVYVAAGLLLVGLAKVLAVWYYFSPEYTAVGYQPVQPVPFSHKLHAGELRIDCRYCHASVEIAAAATVPPTQTCMNCHKLVKRDSAQLALVRESSAGNRPIQWIRVHKVPEYAYFNHGVHLRAGVGCQSCHGDVKQMEKIVQVEPLSMGWCLECHRNPEMHLRPQDQLTNTSWSPPRNQADLAQGLMTEYQIHAPTDCSACHR